MPLGSAHSPLFGALLGFIRFLVFAVTPLDSLPVGTACLPSIFTSLVPNQATYSQEESTQHLVQNGYSPEDVAAALEVQEAVAAAGCFGVDRGELGRRFSALERAEGARSRTLADYVQVSHANTMGPP